MNEWTTTTPTKPGHYYFSGRMFGSDTRYQICVSLDKNEKLYSCDKVLPEGLNKFTDGLWIKQPTLVTFFNAIKRFLRIK